MDYWDEYQFNDDYSIGCELVGGIPTPLKMKVSWDYYSQ